MSLITECRSSQRQGLTCSRTRAHKLSSASRQAAKALLVCKFYDVFQMCRRALDLLSFC